jgi:hypothetical protein
MLGLSTLVQWLLLGEKLGWVSRAPKSGWEVELGALFFRTSASVQLYWVSLKGCHIQGLPTGSIRVVYLDWRRKHMATNLWDMATISNTGHTIIVGLPKHRVLRQNLLVGSAPPRANRARDKAKQRVASSWHTRGPSEETQHPQALYLSLGREVSFTPLREGWHLVVWIFPLGNTQEILLKPPCPNLIGGGGGISPHMVLWRETCHG